MQSWKTSTSFFWEETPFFRLLLPVITAILCYEYHFLPHLKYSFLFIALIFCSFLVFCLSYFKKIIRLSSSINTILVYSSLFILAWFACYTFNIKNEPSWFGNKLSTCNFFVAKVTSEPSEKDKTWKLEVVISKAIHDNKYTKAVGSAFVYVYKNGVALNIHEGDKILLPNKWINIKNSGNPFEFDYASFLKRHNIYYQEFIAANEIVKLNKNPEPPSILDQWHQWGMKQLANYVKDKNSIGLLQAMLLGDKINFDANQRQLYVETGIVHIVAISGGHIAFLFLLITFCFFWIKNKKYQWIKYFVAVPLVWIYVLIAGAPPSAIRAAIMFSLISIGFMFQKNSNTLNQLFAAAFIILIGKPFWLFSVGFQLSFLAVLSLILFYKRIHGLWFPSNLILKRLWNAIAASIAVEILVAPLVIFYFHIFPVAFIFSNIIAWLVMGIIMSAGILILCFSSIPMIAHFIASMVSIIVNTFNHSLSILQIVNPTSLKLLFLSPQQLLVVYLIIISTSIFMIRKYKPSLYAGLIAILILFVSFSYQRWTILQQRKLIVYNINKLNYAELLEGNHYQVILKDTNNQSISYASKEMHIASRTLYQTIIDPKNLFQIGHRYLLILKSPVNLDSAINFSVDYLLLDYPIKEFTGNQLEKIFHFKKLIIPGNQKRYLVNRWKDSCDKYNIAAHFTSLDGAFILSD